MIPWWHDDLQTWCLLLHRLLTVFILYIFFINIYLVLDIFKEEIATRLWGKSTIEFCEEFRYKITLIKLTLITNKGKYRQDNIFTALNVHQRNVPEKKEASSAVGFSLLVPGVIRHTSEPFHSIAYIQN